MRKLASVLLLNLAIISGLANAVQGESAATAPDELTEVISGIENAANDQDIDELLEYYSDNFTNTDGLTTETLANALIEIWDSYSQLQYTTEIESWSQEGDELVAETITTIEGIQDTEERQASLNSTIKSRQYFQDQKLVRQEILLEQSQINSGDNPPQVQINAPTVVKAGAKYNFDLIVNEPLGERVLLGAVQEEKTAANLYLNPTALELEPLPAGGIYKVATAPLLTESNWISAILVRGDGITMVTHRINIESKP
ncbi:MAG: nuclear transport factor 2 family protein [Pleurocapsa sp.]